MKRILVVLVLVILSLSVCVTASADDRIKVSAMPGTSVVNVDVQGFAGMVSMRIYLNGNDFSNIVWLYQYTISPNGELSLSVPIVPVLSIGDVIEVFINNFSTTYTIPKPVSFDYANVSASVVKLNGNKNELIITITEVYTDESSEVTNYSFLINNNSSGTYEAGQYRVFVDTKGNTSIRACYFVE